MSNMKEFSASSNGDRWFLANDRDGLYVVHKGNEPSGGYERRTTIENFVAEHMGKPEHAALLQLLGQSQSQVDDHLEQEKIEASSAVVAEKYLDLGGRREVTIECEVVTIRVRADEPLDADAFWKAHIAPLPEKDRHEIAVHLSHQESSAKESGARPDLCSSVLERGCENE